MLAMLGSLFVSCSSYARFKQRSQRGLDIDTTYSEILAYSPKDSVILRVKTDTTTVYQTIRQGKAQIIYQRDHTNTIVQAKCDPDTIRVKVPVRVETARFGVNPIWKTVGIGTLSLLVLIFIAGWLVKNFTIQKR